jgi:hypothetical protein
LFFNNIKLLSHRYLATGTSFASKTVRRIFCTLLGSRFLFGDIWKYSRSVDSTISRVYERCADCRFDDMRTPPSQPARHLQRLEERWSGRGSHVDGCGAEIPQLGAVSRLLQYGQLGSAGCFQRHQQLERLASAVDILDEHQVPSESFSTDNIGQWTPTLVHTQPETVAPSATFQLTLASSPCKLEPMTPLRYPAPAAASILSSSPCPLYSPGQISAREEYELAEQILEAMPMPPKHVPKARRGGGRSSRPKYEHKCLSASGRTKSAVSKSGMACDVVIEGNKYACEFADCMDKNGKRKMFKRREHAKRHVDTVHLKKKQFRCWVPGCTTQPFTRSDNLTTHLKSTHGKKSISSRNRYVSTLDPASGNFDPEWRGVVLKSIRSRL